MNPAVPMGLCASYTHYDLEGVELDDLLRMLAGAGKPFLRLSGAAYWPIAAPRYAGQDLGGVTEFCRMQVGWLRGQVQSGRLTLIDENDPYPRDHTVVPAAQDIRLTLRAPARITRTLRCEAAVSGCDVAVKTLPGYGFAAVTVTAETAETE